jgi:predicted PolB exonuclease-like 3'-5' exonuclease
MSEIVIDIETIPGKFGQDVMEIANQRLAKKKDKDMNKLCSVEWPFAHIICIGVGIDGRVGTLIGEEKDVLEAFWVLIGRKTDEFQPHNSRYVTFNGKDFDIPFIINRSAINGIIPSVRIPTRRYYNDRHFDVLEELSNHFQSTELKLKDYCKIFGVENTDDIDGSEIYSLWLKGDKAAIEKHCASDVRATHGLFERIKNFF